MDALLIIEMEILLLEEMQLLICMLGKKLSISRQKLGFSPRNIAKTMGYSSDFIYDIERQPANHTIKQVIQYASLIGTSVTDNMHVNRKSIRDAHVVIIDNSHDRLNLYRKLFKRCVQGNNCYKFSSLMKAHESVKLQELDLVIIHHNKKNDARDLLRLMHHTHINKNVNIVIIAKDNHDEISRICRDSRQNFWVLKKDNHGLLTLVDDLLRLA